MKYLKSIQAAFLILVIVIGFTQCQNTDTDININFESSEIAFGPYIQQLSYKDVEICWSTTEGTTKLYSDGDSLYSSINQYENHKTIITNLEPNTTYSYDVLNDGTDNGKGEFTTAPRGIEDFHFIALGDTRTRHDVHQKIVNGIIKRNPDFVINTGDLVGNGNNIHDWEHFFNINKNLMKDTPYYTVLGNHEKNSENYFNFFSLPDKESYYFFTRGDALFIILDFEGPNYQTPAYLKGESREKFWTNISKDYFNTEKKWLENVLELNKEAGYIFVFFHPTYYSIHKSRVEEAEKRREYWGDIFERYQVTAVLNGHDHYYHHAVNNGTHYIVTAGGGAPLYSTDAIQPETVNYKMIEHFVDIEVNKTNAIFNVIDIDGHQFDTIKVKRRNAK
ncbi:MAG: metallophosphoesterase [Bacteroidales bacterium]|nr:metallophosphoesterase [Bacteroidales bacterium]